MRLFWRQSERSAALKNRSAKRAAARRFRPRLEALENREMLSAGSLDPTFGNGGVAAPAATIHGFVGGATVYPTAGAATDGDVVAVGTKNTSGANEFTVVRYAKSGAPDATFGHSGEADTSFGRVSSYGEAAVIQGNGEIVEVGYTQATRAPLRDAFALARYNTNGSLDTTFGKSGLVTTTFAPTTASSYFSQAYAAALQPADGKIIAAGITDKGAVPVDNSIAVARYNANGSLDTTFGRGGEVVTPHTAIPGSLVDPSGQYGNTGVRSVAVQADGKILVGGYTVVSSTSMEAFFARYTSSGTLDPTFGNGGIATLPAVNVGAGYVTTQAYYTIGYMAVEPSGEIAVTGVGGQMALLQSNGALDTSFGAGGVAIVPAAGPLALEPNGEIVSMNAGGATGYGPSQVARYVSNGALDASFGAGGSVSLAAGAYGNDIFSALAVQPDGKIDVVGGPPSPSNANPTLIAARLLPSEPEIGSFAASASSIASGGALTLTASNIADANPGASIAQVAFYYIDGSGAKQTLGYGTQTSPGVWTLNFNVNLAIGTYTIYAQATDSYGVVGDADSLSLQVT